MTRQPDALKTTANELAAFFASTEGAHVFQAMKRLARERVPSRGRRADAQADVSREAIGIWMPKTENGATRYVRSRLPQEPWSDWANVASIPPKSSRARIVLVGESVARGFFLDPAFNPGTALRAFIGAAAGDEAVEVIDLARIGLELQPLVDLTTSIAALAPDAIVVFAGNNWRPVWEVGDDALLDVAAMLEAKASWADVKAYLESLLTDRVNDAVASVARFAQSLGIPLVWVIPEFNLRDWRSDVAAPSFLSAAATMEWCRAREAAERASAARDWTRVGPLARRLIELDGGTTAAGANLLADLHLHLDDGDTGEARRWFERARDAAVCWSRPEAPRRFSVARDAVINGAAAHGFTVVDVADVLRTHWPDGLPDRRMFFDSCHLTLDGIRVTMAAVVEALLPRLGLPRRDRAELLRVPTPIEDKVLAEAHVLAAIHSAHWGQGREIVRYHSARAFAASASIATLMHTVLAAEIKSIPYVLCREFAELAASGSLSAISHILYSPLEDKVITWTLVDALTETLAPTRPDLRQRVVDLACREHGVDDRRVNLLDSVHWTDSRLVPLDREYGYHRVSTQTARFRFHCAGPRPLTVTATCRCRHCDERECLAVRVNGHPIARVPATRTWQTVTIPVPATALTPGENVLEIGWPDAAWDLDDWKQVIAGRMERRMLADTSPVWGELHELSVCAAAGEAQPSPREADGRVKTACR